MCESRWAFGQQLLDSVKRVAFSYLKTQKQNLMPQQNLVPQVQVRGFQRCAVFFYDRPDLEDILLHEPGTRNLCNAGQGRIFHCSSQLVHVILKILYVRFPFVKMLFSPLCITRIVLFQDFLYGVGILYSIIIFVHSVNFKLGYFVE